MGMNGQGTVVALRALHQQPEARARMDAPRAKKAAKKAAAKKSQPPANPDPLEAPADPAKSARETVLEQLGRLIPGEALAFWALLTTLIPEDRPVWRGFFAIIAAASAVAFVWVKAYRELKRQGGGNASWQAPFKAYGGAWWDVGAQPALATGILTVLPPGSWLPRLENWAALAIAVVFLLAVTLLEKVREPLSL